MKKSVFLFAIICFFLTVQTVKAQNSVTMLQHNGTSTAYYGLNSFINALTAAINGDTLYLSTGFFNAPTITKGVNVFGTGHFPDSANVSKRTTIMGDIIISKGADNLLLEGLYITFDIKCQGDASINYVKVARCNFVGAQFSSSSPAFSKDFCSFDECFIRGVISFNNSGTNFHLRHSILQNYISDFENALIEGNVFLTNGPGSINSSVLRNNIFCGTQYPFFNCNNNSIKNNLLVINSFDWGTNSSSNNYFGVPQANIFVNQTGNAINYAHDYHLKNTELYLGTDGTQVGLYGGTSPFKDKGLPNNPQIIKKQIADETDANGNLQINMTIKAQ